ncbi:MULTISPECIES: SDR family oxidoreductase [Thalassospira]|jgi:NADP-dependent 3-hydroxy acid dehydrogenase YdfG|uniref:Oxidoreductase n=1 Tax=Thalassospira xiamenensis TaxID=220697 RepID=A0ABR5Y6K6_9PROT|nr:MULTISPECIES: SDR family oxidoreductase [Thalassospira]MAL28105.1 NAD(P)-dependent oxidoreductase [Thalassospira sp.]MBR9782226.1 SDR family oxidoreductase [Rhodospirillales bacterium]KZD06897.1 oxidoreductase [Thalassospira xiamenensis]KZD09185.1 oxidoreductase [Thalassospira xiamenensis]MBL4842813.1 SDR family oxidoreductase [Thalassospira sp.]|tara:strand:+ start:424 stop:1173 length:750 start_codon:yes stop_codon:yes gene_type:complete
MPNLEGKVALITGASSGIGAATARKLAKAGITVGIAARRLDRLEELKSDIEKDGGKAITIEMDVADVKSVETGVGHLVAEARTIDILFNNAGLMPLSDIDEFKIDEWHRMVDVNMKGLLNTTAAALPHMIAQKSGHVFNTSSIAGRKVFKGLTVYCATKHAVTAFSDGLRMEIGKKHNIRVTCIQPGAVSTELYEQISDPVARQQMEDLRTQMTFLEGDDIADTVLYALKAPTHMNMAEMFVMPTQQEW